MRAPSAARRPPPDRPPPAARRPPPGRPRPPPVTALPLRRSRCHASATWRSSVRMLPIASRSVKRPCNLVCERNTSPPAFTRVHDRLVARVALASRSCRVGA